MRRLALLALLVFATVLAEALDQGHPAPGFTGKDFSGNDISFPSLIDGKPTVMIFWATWCPYCRAFMPYLGEIQADYENQINIVAINAKERGHGDTKAYIEGLGYPVIGVADGDAIAKTYGVEYIPGLMIVDGEGLIAWKRASTELPAGKTVAELWDGQVRKQLDALLHKD